MPLALILSSYVAADRVGGFAQSLVFAEAGIDPLLAPTVLFGRHPGHGAPGGQALSADLFQSVLDGIAAQGLWPLTDLVLTGYFSDPDQVRAAAALIRTLREAPAEGLTGRRRIVVDPVLGDTHKGLYVKSAVAEALASELVPLADILTPNLFELAYLEGQSVARLMDGPEALLESARALSQRTGAQVMVTSVPGDTAQETGVLAVTPEGCRRFRHAASPRQWSGAGDLFSAALGVALIRGDGALAAAEQATRTVAETIACSEAWGSPVLSVVAMGPRLSRPAARLATDTL